MTDVWLEFTGRYAEWLEALVEHLVMLTAVPVGLAILIAVPSAIAVRNLRVVRTIITAVASIVQTIPSLAMLAFLLPLMGIGKVPAITALTLYAILPILQNTLAALREVPESLMDAARGLGFSRRQRLLKVELPLAVPFIVSGIRTATVICVGIATLSTFIGAGGLGDFINRGLALNRMSLLVLGAASAALLALLCDFCLETVGELLAPGRVKVGSWVRAALMVCVCCGIAWFLTVSMNRTARDETAVRTTATIRIGTKNFTEQLILGELLAQWIEMNTDLGVDRIFNLGGTIICHEAITRGEIDLYPEYTGTSLLTILKEDLPGGTNVGARVYERVRERYTELFDLAVLPPFGFENTYAITVRRQDAAANNWVTIDDLAAGAGALTAGFTSEFVERPDGLPGLSKEYGYTFGSVRDLSPELMYGAIAQSNVDVICAFSTDARIVEYDLLWLRDTRAFFPPYEAVPVVRSEVLRKHPELREALRAFAGGIGAEQMTELNHAVDVAGKSPREVAAEFLAREQFSGDRAEGAQVAVDQPE